MNVPSQALADRDSPHVLIVEADPQLGDLLAYHLRSEGFSVLVAHSGEQALGLARSEPLAIVLLAMHLPDIAGMTCAQILRAESDVAILLLAERPDGADGIAGLELGADDYVLKPVRLTELVARVRARLRRRPAKASAATPPLDEVLVANDLHIYPASRRAFRKSQELSLAQKEFDLLTILVRYRGCTLPRDLLFKAVWGRVEPDGERTIDVHIRWLRMKIEDDPAQPTCIQTVRGIGYRFADS